MNENFVATKLQASITAILVMVISITGFTYAYFAISISNNTTINGTAATVNLTLDVQKIFPLESSTNTGVLVPQLSVSGSNTSPLSSALKNGCVDANGNVVCQVYKIDIKNDGGTAAQVVDGFVSFYGDSELTTDVSISMPSLKWKLIDTANATTPNNSVLGTASDKAANFNDNVFAADVLLKTNDSYSYNMIIWINETNDDQPVDEGSSFYGKIKFNSSNGTGVTSTFNATI